MSATGGDSFSDSQVDRRNRNRLPEKEKTLWELYEEALKEQPKDIADLEVEGRPPPATDYGRKAAGQHVTQTPIPTGNGDHTANALAAKMAIKHATRRATKKYILQRTAEIATFRSTSYADALARAHGKGRDMLGGSQHTNPKGGKPESARTEQAISGAAQAVQYQDHMDAWGNLIPNDNGWTTVNRKKRYNRPRQEAVSQLSKWNETLLKQGRCFKCLAKGHRSFQCTGKIKCLKCTLTGHTVGSCKKELPAPTINRGVDRGVKAHQVSIKENNPPKQPHTTPIEQTPQTNRQKSTIKEQAPTMDPLANWETMTLNDPRYVNDSRVDGGRVFLPNRVGFAPGNEFLSRSAVVLTGPNQNNRHLAHSITRKLAHHFSTNIRNIRVSKLPATTGDFIAIFPTDAMCKQAVDICAFTVLPGVHVQLAVIHNKIKTQDTRSSLGC
ncbi:hypothetical protein FCM35_KLT06805 [Carex littledalei]|uniref:CCHC-type domain-containing protein n=1 Tax=Carex littledalei TaxID=544730 RepID=A0A833VLW2_9POAL|nr:hypothetical protein FCM35_KLT06805 [Carex littledalei]